MSVLRHKLKIGEEIWIGDACITLQKKSGKHALIFIEAPPDVKIRTPQSDDTKEEQITNQTD